jgi:hypothetical protein
VVKLSENNIPLSDHQVQHPLTIYMALDSNFILGGQGENIS